MKKIFMIFSLSVLLTSISFATITDESFESGTPTGWVISGGYLNTGSAYDGTHKVGFNSSGDYLRTDQQTDPGELTFYIRTSSDPDNWTIKVQTSTDDNNYTDQETITENGSGGEITDTYTKITVTLNLTGKYYIRWYMSSRSTGSAYLDLVNLSATSTPVELKSFTATVKDNNVELNWATATEVNNYGFQVERKSMQSESGWEEIGFVQGHGVSNSTKYYSYIDNPFEKGSYSYRLKQIDLDGAFKYSNVVSVDLGSVTKFALKQNYPNPFNPTTEISFDVPKESRVRLSVYNALGQKVADLLNENLSAGTHRVQFDGSALTSGIYFYKMQSAGFTSIKKMILMK